MSLDKLAKLLYVDEVNLMHGPKGVAVYVRIEKSWHSTTIDNEELGERRLEVIAEHLEHLADAHVHKARRTDLRKAPAPQPERRDFLSWEDVGGFKPWGDGPQQQIQRVEPSYAPQPPPEVSSEPAVSKAMPSRFHAIIEELKNL